MHELIDTAQAAEILNVSPATLRSWRLRGYGPAYYKLGLRLVRYKRAEIVAWLETNLADGSVKR